MSKIFSWLLFVSILFSILAPSCKSSESKAATTVEEQPKDTPVNELSLLFMGDIMQHGPQIRAAYVDSSKSYDYTSCFAQIAPIAQNCDFAIANLELTLAGEPFSGYPQFSAPDELAVAIKNAGINRLVTANNHSADRGSKGIERTVEVLDRLGIPHTGTFKDSADWRSNNPMLLEKNGFKIVLLNYTFSTNGLPVNAPNMVNYIDEETITRHLKAAKTLKGDKIIVFMHWGDEYQNLPNDYQKSYAKLCFKNGADYVIGAHPHVLQPMERWYDSAEKEEKILVYSLGNFVSNQRERYKDGGAMFKMVLQKKDTAVSLKEAGYLLTWVDITEKSGHKEYIIYPAAMHESDSLTLDKSSLEKLNIFTTDSRELFNKNNKSLREYRYDEKAGWKVE